MALYFEDGGAADYHFVSATRLLRARGKEEEYRASEIRPGVVFIDFIASDRPAGAISLVLDLDHGLCTALEAQLPSEAEARIPLIERLRQNAELTGVRAKFRSGTIDAPFGQSAHRHSDTRELIGKRIEYIYSRSERYEHVYLNERFYTWHCVAGSERGLADTDRCRYLKIADRLYFFVWREKAVPTLGAVLVDLAQMKTTGKIFGYRSFDFGAIVNFPVGAHARVLDG